MHVESAAPAPLLDDDSIGLEERVDSGDHQSVKLWLRMLACTTQVENQIRRRLRTEFGTTQARFDYLAHLHRHADGLRMNALSRYLMVTGGNVTGLTDELEKEGLVERLIDPADRRSVRVVLTRKGRRLFERVASVYGGWVIRMFAGLSGSQQSQLHDLLGRLRVDLAATQNAAASQARSADA